MPHSARCRDVPFLLGVLAVLLYAQQYVTLVKLNIFPPGVTFGTPGLYFKAVFDRVHFDWLDVSLALSIAATCGLLLLREIQSRRLSLFLNLTFASNARTTALMGVAGLLLVRFYLARGDLSWAADAPQHISFAHITARALAEMELPIWTYYFGTWTPYLQFYGFLFFYLVGLLNLATGDIYLSLKGTMALCHVASGIAMYLFVGTVCGSRRAGFLAGVGYVASFWHVQQIIIMGRLPLSLFYALLPLPFYYFERLSAAATPRLEHAAWGGLALGALAWTHPGYAFWATVLLGVYVAVRLWEQGEFRPWSSLARHAVVLLAAGLIFGAYLTLPMWVEREFTGLHGDFSQAQVPDPTWQQIFIWSNFRFWLLPISELETNWYGGYVGLSLVSLAAVGAAGVFAHERLRRSGTIAALVCLALVALLVFGYRLPLLQLLPPVHILSAGRYLLFGVFFLALLAGHGCRLLLIRSAAGKFPGRPYTPLLLLVLLDLGPTTFQHPYLPAGGSGPAQGDAERSNLLRDDAGALPDNQIPDDRVFWPFGDIHPYLAIGKLYFITHTPAPFAPHPGDVRAASAFVEPLERYISAALTGSGRTDWEAVVDENKEILRALKLLNVRYLLCAGSDDLVQIRHASPVLVSPRIAPYPAEQIDAALASGHLEHLVNRLASGPEQISLIESILPTFWIIEQMGIDLVSNRCDQFPLLDFDSVVDLGTSPDVEVLEHRAWNQRVEMKIRTSEAGFVRLAYAYFPYVDVTVNGRDVTAYQSAGRFFVLRLPAGEHEILLQPHLSPLRRGMLILNLGLLATTIALALRQRVRGETGSGTERGATR